MGIEIQPDADTAIWLRSYWDLGLEWDEGNIGKLEKHDLSVPLVETVFEEPFVFTGKILPPQGRDWGESRFLILGKTAGGRYLTIIWTKRATKIRPISVRGMRKNEKEVFQKATRQR